MSNHVKSTQEILDKFGIEQFNTMQEESIQSIRKNNVTVLLSPTGTGKTLAFLMPLLDLVDPDKEEVQCLILVPARELAIQIEQVARQMGAGYKIAAVYGGQQIRKDKIELKHTPSIVIGTPGRVVDHLERGILTPEHIKVVILDEYDKSLEIGFEEQMKFIMEQMQGVKKIVLSSATELQELPSFVNVDKAHTVNHLDSQQPKLSIKIVNSPKKDKLETLSDLLQHLANQRGIVFCNFRDAIQRVSDFLDDQGINHGVFYGGMEQIDRERALIKFRNGTNRILLATDLAARGIDVDDLEYIIHYHLPLREEEFIHRNGRTARMHAEGTVFVIWYEEDELPEYLQELPVAEQLQKRKLQPGPWETLYISGGRKDKISKVDIVGWLIKQGRLNSDDLGLIEIKSDCAFVAIDRKKSSDVIKRVNNSKLKRKKVRAYII